MAMMQRYAGIVSARLPPSKVRSVTVSNIKNPTKINAGAVAKDGMEVNNGENKVASRNKTPVVHAVSPVRPPTATPEEDSTKVVVVEVPRIAPAEVAMASDNNAGLIFGSFPFSSSIFAFVLTPINVPNVSNKSTNRKENTITIKLKMPTA